MVAHPTTFLTLYSDEDTDNHHGNYRPVLSKFSSATAITSAELFARVNATGIEVPNAYIGYFDAPGVVGGLSMVLHAVAMYPLSLGAPSQWDNRSFAFAQDVAANGDILTIKMSETSFRLMDGNNTITVPDSLDAVNELLNASPDARLLDALEPNTPGTIQLRTRHLMWLPAKYIPICLAKMFDAT